MGARKNGSTATSSASALNWRRCAMPASSCASVALNPSRARSVPRYFTSSERILVSVCVGLRFRTAGAADPLISVTLKSNSTPPTTEPYCQL